MFEAFMRRKAVEEAREVKNAMTSGLWANSNYDDGKNTRTRALQDIEETFQKTIRIIYNQQEEFEVNYDQPLFSAIPDDLKSD